MRFANARRAEPMIDVTPMIDIVFQLVLFFMVSTTFVSAPGIQVDLPRANAQLVITEQEDINIWVTADGAVFVDDEPVDLPGLRSRLDNAVRRDPSTLVVVKADAGVSHGRVVTVMDMARGLGLSRLAIATELDGAGADDDEP
jgi:biopolymer transport protein ExbD